MAGRLRAYVRRRRYVRTAGERVRNGGEIVREVTSERVRLAGSERVLSERVRRRDRVRAGRVRRRDRVGAGRVRRRDRVHAGRKRVRVGARRHLLVLSE